MPVPRIEKKSFGFTLIELVVILAVLAIILGIATPALRDMLVRSRITAELDDLNASLAYARSEAIKQGLNVIVCPSITVGSATPTCAGVTAWETGWLVIAVTGDCTSTAGVILRQRNTFSSTDAATYTPGTAGNNNICFNRFGLASSGYTGQFVFTQSGGGSPKRCLSLSAAGIGQSLNAGDADMSGWTCQ